MNTLTKLSVDANTAPDTNDLDGWVVVDGNPTMRTWALHTNSDGTMLSGVWEANAPRSKLISVPIGSTIQRYI
jgi:uncharacterized cupin superfamily protein